MAFQTANGIARVIGAGIDIGSVAKNFNTELMLATPDSTVLNDTARKFVFDITSGNFSLEAFLSMESGAGLADGSWDLLKAALRAGNVIIAGTVGDAVGAPAAGMVAKGTKGGVMPSVGDVTGVKIEGECDPGPDFGVMLQPWATKTAVFNGTSFDNAAASTNVLPVGYIAWDAFAGTSVTFKLQHSTDNSVWADIGSPVVINTESGGARIAGSVGTLNRYRRIIASAGTFTTVKIIGMVAAVNQ